MIDLQCFIVLRKLLYFSQNKGVFFDLLAVFWLCLSKNSIKNRCNLLIYSDLGGEWGSNPRHSEPQSDALPTEL